jgi:hypothetical protein
LAIEHLECRKPVHPSGAGENSRDELELDRAMDIAAIHIDHAIAVEEESAARQSVSRFHRFLEPPLDTRSPNSEAGPGILASI